MYELLKLMINEVIKIIRKPIKIIFFLKSKLRVYLNIYIIYWLINKLFLFLDTDGKKIYPSICDLFIKTKQFRIGTGSKA